MEEVKLNISNEYERGAMEGEKSKKSSVKDEKVPFHKLFSFADRKDIVLMIFGTISAVANGMTNPLLTILFGNLVNAFMSLDVSKEVSKVPSS